MGVGYGYGAGRCEAMTTAVEVEPRLNATSRTTNSMPSAACSDSNDSHNLVFF